MRRIRIPAFAKINLQLRVLGRRSDGFHELRTVFQAVSLRDTLAMEFTDGRAVEFTCSEPSLPQGRDNLVVRALVPVRQALGIRAGLRVRLTKRIPSAAGLGGGSSDAAAAIVGLQRLAGRWLPLSEQMRIAAGLGADVPFFLCGGRGLGVSRGDEVYPLADISRRWVVIVSPSGIAVPTKDAYAWLRRGLTSPATQATILRFCALCSSPQGDGLLNDFEAAVFRRFPRLARIKRELLRRGAAEASLAGSGSAVFGIFQHPAMARRAASAMGGATQDRVFVTHTLTRRQFLRAMGLPRP